MKSFFAYLFAALAAVTAIHWLLHRGDGDNADNAEEACRVYDEWE